MKQKFGIKKTKMNIFWLLLAGLIIGGVIGLRQSAPSASDLPVQNITIEAQQGAK